MCCVYICDSVSRRRRNPMWTCVLSRLFAEVDGTIVIMSLLPEGVLCVGRASLGRRPATRVSGAWFTSRSLPS